jgi:hypothetical protein
LNSSDAPFVPTNEIEGIIWMKPAKTGQLDPLYVIFEQHLYNFQDSDSDRSTFISNIVRDYISYLRRLNITVPRSLEQSICEELFTQVNTMLVKKIYGCLSIQDYQKNLTPSVKRKVETRYLRLAKKA